MKFEKLVNKLRARRKAMLAVLVDPDKFNPELIRLANPRRVSCFLVGGSRLHSGDADRTVKAIRSLSKIPVVLFPGDENQLSRHADGLLLISLVSGRNADYLIGKHVKAAPLIRKMKLPHLSTAYILIDGGRPSATQQVTGTDPLDPADETQILNTAIAAEQLGFQAVYLEAGSGADKPVALSTIRKIRRHVSIPVIVGGGIDSPAKARALVKAGAGLVVVGNALENDVYLLTKIGALF